MVEDKKPLSESSYRDYFWGRQPL